ncbi:ammonium transporter [Candidatus Poriferisodalis sp.]|uniref:ammonium transporter n=1 Tax=Candidatus Poriferisodalis sp. TaxID=3101277 RepID=UPI003B01E034
MVRRSWFVRATTSVLLAVGLVAAFPAAAHAAQPAADPGQSDLQFVISSFSLLIWGALVMWMCAGFTMLESGTVRTKNASMICLKNVGIYSIAALTYLFIGYNLMYVDVGDLIGSFRFLYSPLDAEVAALAGDVSGLGDAIGAGSASMSNWLFQMLFVATTASIVSGAMLERVRLWSFWLFTVFLTAFIYPTVGAWIWGGGWLEQAGFRDFAGGTVVHTVGGCAALVGMMIVGPRLGKFRLDGTVKATPPSNVLVTTLGVLILWLGWFGFNAGSHGSLATPQDVIIMSAVLINTNLAAASGMLASVIISRRVFGRVGLSSSLNGALAGLVSVTAAPSMADHWWAVVIGAIAGVLCTVVTWLLERMKLDDVVGAVPVHLVAGVWGTLAAAITTDVSLSTQLLGVASVMAFVLIASYVVWKLIDFVLGVRVATEIERIGQDIGELGIESHPEFLLAPDDFDEY